MSIIALVQSSFETESLDLSPVDLDVWRVQAHSQSARAVAFSPDARLLLTASADGSILAADCGTGVAAARLGGAHACGINRLTFSSESVLASGTIFVLSPPISKNNGM